VVSVVDLEGGPYAVSVHPDTHQVYVSTALMNTMVVLDGHSLHVTATIPLASQPGGLALDAVRDRLFIAHAREGALTEVALHSGQVLGTLPAGAWPSGIAIDPSSGWVCVVDRDAETLTLVDPSERSVAATLSLTPGEQVARAD